MSAHAEGPLKHTATRYLLAVVAAVVALVLRALLEPLTGSGARFVLSFAAVLVVSLFVGTGPGALTLALSLPLSAYQSVTLAGAPVSESVVQTLLYAMDGLIILYVASRVTKRRESLHDANRELRRLNEEAARSELHTRQIIELAPDAFFLSDLAAAFTDVNHAACEMLGYQREELLGKTIYDIIPAEDAERLKETRKQLLVPGATERGEWTLKRKDGTTMPVDVAANILSDGRWQAFIRDITERRRIEDQRRILVSFLDNSVDFIGVADHTGKPLYINAAGRRMVGLAPDAPIEQLKIEEFYPPDLRTFVTDVLLKTMHEKGVWSGETFLQNFQTHEKIPVSDTHFLIRDTSGQRVLGMGTVTRDMTRERRIAEEREGLLASEQAARLDLESANAHLSESEERFRLAIDEAPIGMALVSLDGHFVRVNHVLCEITGYSPDELMKLRFQDITHPDDVDSDVEASHRLARGDIPRYHIEKRYVRKDGSIVDVTLSAAMVRDASDAPLYYISQVEDITARKRAEHALRLSEAKFSGIVSIAADAIISVDGHQRITIFNEGAEQIFGYARGDMIGAELNRLIPERFRASHNEDFARFAAGPENARKMGERREVYGLRNGGEEFPAEASISKVAVGNETFFSVVLRDITDRKKVEEALRRAVAARDDVLRVVAHDLRNPLSAIMMEAQILEDPESEALRRDLQPGKMILRSAKRMSHLIEDLLDVALVEAGQLKVEKTRLSAGQLAREAVESQTTLATNSEIEIRLEIEPGVHELWGDHKRLLQVFENLIGNAIKFSEPGDRIVVSASMKHNDVLFAVADTGSGIDPESLCHVFDPFWQAATRARRLGAGLGLPVTKGIVEAHGGRIWVESEPGRGSTFFFTVPASEPTADARPPAPVPANSGDGQPHPPTPRQDRRHA
ncbi:MAG TPA: PAS domain S-box protein [Gemmatimonadaceae bacterium]